MAVSDCFGHGAKMSCQCELIPCRSIFCSDAALEAQKLRIAMSLLIGFHALLRTNEIIHIQALRFTFSQKYGSVLLVLPLVKSGQRLQRVPETVTVTDPLVLAYLWAVVPCLQPGLFHASTRVFRPTISSPSSIQVASILFETARSHRAFHGVWQSEPNNNAWEVGFNQNHTVIGIYIIYIYIYIYIQIRVQHRLSLPATKL